MTNTAPVLDAPTSSGPPAANLRTPNVSQIVVGIVNVNEYQQRDYDSRDPLFWDNGTPKMGKVVTGIVVSAVDTGITIGDDERDVQPGDLVSFWCEKGKHFTWRDAVKEHGQVNPGDVMLWKRLDDEPPKKRGAYPGKVYKATIRKPEAKDGDLRQRCNDAYWEAQKAPALDAPPAAPAAAPFDDEEPF